MVQVFLRFMPMTQESMWLMCMPNSAITVSQMHLPPPLPPTHTNLPKGNGWDKEIVWSFEMNENDINLNYVLNISAYMQNISSSIFFILESKHFTSENGVLVFFSINNQISNRHSMHLSVRNMPHLIVQKNMQQTNAKTSCLNPKAGHYFTAKTGNFLSQEEVGGIDRKIP